MLSANDTAERGLKPVKGVYLMTDILGNQRRVKIVPAGKSLLIELLEQAPKLKTNKSYNDFVYEKGSVRLKYADYSLLYCFNDKEFKLYTKDGSEPLYFEFQGRI